MLWERSNSTQHLSRRLESCFTAWIISASEATQIRTMHYQHIFSDVNKDLTLKAKDRTFEGLNRELDM